MPKSILGHLPGEIEMANLPKPVKDILKNFVEQMQRVYQYIKNDMNTAGYVEDSDMVSPDLIEQDTEVWIIIGPLISSLDGTTPVESLVLGDITAAIYKGVTRSVLTLSSGNFVELEDGYIKLKLTASDTDTAGRLLITLRDDDVFLSKSRELWVK
jgi:hypothetical protein